MRNALAYAPIVDPMPEQGTPAQLEPDILLPEQIENVGRRCMRPEHRLMLAVLEDAVHAYQTGCASYGGERRLNFRETADWFASDDTEWPFSFVTICQHFGIEPEYIRAGLRRWREQHRARVPGAVRAVPFRVRRVHGSRHRVTSARRWRAEA
jgi:hypothetical protein